MILSFIGRSSNEIVFNSDDYSRIYRITSSNITFNAITHFVRQGYFVYRFVKLKICKVCFTDLKKDFFLKIEIYINIEKSSSCCA